MPSRTSLTPSPLSLDDRDEERIARSPRIRTAPRPADAFRIPTPSILSVSARLPRWLFALARVFVAIAWDRLRGRDTTARRAAHVRRSIESLGPLAVKVAQQISTRVDVWPLEYTAELSRMRDTAPPMRFNDALERVENAIGRAVGRTIEDVFEGFDPEPIVSDSISCVYQAVLRTGEKVAVKVRRPNVLAALSVEHAVVDLLIRGFGLFVSHPHFTRSLSRELQPLLFETVNFVRVARLQSIFRRETRRHRLRFLNAAKVFLGFCSPDVIVSEFVSGVWLDEVIAAKESNNRDALAKLAAIGIDPDVCGRRLQHISWWGFFEGMFFSELPAASQIVVQPGGCITFVNLGSTTNLDRRHRRLVAIALTRFAEHDVHNGVELLLQLLMPLPAINLHDLTKDVESRVWASIFAMENSNAPWWERTGTALWLAVMDVAREHRVPMRLNVSRMMQSACMYDHLASRLAPDLLLFREFRRYIHEARKRRARLALRDLSDVDDGQSASLLSNARKVARQVSLQGESLIEELPVEYSTAVKKGSYLLSESLSLMLACAKLFLALTVARMGFVWRPALPLDPIAAGIWASSHPVFIALCFAFVLLSARRILFRLGDVDRRKD